MARQRRTTSVARALALLGLLVVASACSSSNGVAGETSPPRTSTTVAATTTERTTTTTERPATTTSAPTTTGAPATTTTLPASPPDPAALAAVRLRLEPVADVSLLTAAAADASTGRVYLTTQDGEVWMLVLGAPAELVLDITSSVSPWVEGSERGLLGVAVGPVDHRLYLSFTDVQLDSHVVSFALDPLGHPDPASGRSVFFLDQPAGGLGHKGGGLAFEPDGTMYLALGDGGASDGLDAQNPLSLLGSVLRIRPNPDGDGYTVPADNPFVGRTDLLPELWAKGLRNPWGFCRDAATGDLWLSDVGNHTMEEIDRIPAGTGGLNFGWYWIEGTYVRVGGAPDGIVPPVFAYRHDEVGPAAIGGCVYRGAGIPGLQGAYVFADITGDAFAIGAGDVAVPLQDRFESPVTGFAVLPDGEMLVLTLYSGAFLLRPA